MQSDQFLPFLRSLLAPIARFCVRHRVLLAAFIEIAKEEFAQAARAELAVAKQKATTSRVSLMTGIHRREVVRLRDHPNADPQHGVLVRVVALWQTDQRFTTSRGDPRVLSHGGTGSEFHALVATVHREFNAATVLTELEHSGFVERTPRGIALRRDSFAPRGDPAAGFRIAGDDIRDLINAVEFNTLGDRSPPMLHARTEYDKVRAEDVPELRRWLLEEGHIFQRKVRDRLAQLDQDTTPSVASSGRTVRVAVTSFSNIDEKPR